VTTAIRLEEQATPALAGRPAPSRRHVLSDYHDVAWASVALAGGGIIAQGFANFYVITTRPDEETVRRVNRMKGRSPTQVGSITSTPARIPLAYDWSKLPAGLTRRRVRDLMRSLFQLGPFGFRGPAASHVPAHLTQVDDGITTTQVIAPGYACPSNDFLAASLDAVDDDLLFITSAKRSWHVTGAADERAHWQAGPLAAEFGAEPGFAVLEHADEEAARRAYPLFAPMSVTILAFHKLGGRDSRGRPCLIVERHGSLGVGHLRPILAELGFGLVLGPHARQRLLQRGYDEAGAA
jgi:hypothetical protein